MCCNKLLSVLEKEKIKFDYVYDWTTYANLKERKQKKNPNILRSSVTITNSKIKKNDNIYMKKLTFSHCIEDFDGFENAKIKIMDTKKTKKNSDLDVSNKANIDENDSAGIGPKNESCCCKM